MVISKALLAMAMVCVVAGAVRGGLPEMAVIGEVAVRPAKEIRGSDWSVGCETLDRDFARYGAYRDYLGPLGAKAIRVQTGWAKCEKKKGEYDFKWLDEVVDDALAQGVRPWLETSYGNPIYEGGGGRGLGGGFPKSEEALAAWDKWVRALAARYRDRVDEWEVWNEPDLVKGSTGQEYAALYVRTAEIIRAEQPKARLYALAMGWSMDYAKAFLDRMKELEKLGLIDAVTVHGYPENPDDTTNVDKVRALAGKYSNKIEVRQGETGAPSVKGGFGALRGVAFTEVMQAKWNLRRLLAHHAKGVPMNLFTLVDLKYGPEMMNTKGLLKARADGTVEKAKPAYGAAQRVFSIFDETLVQAKEVEAKAEGERKMAISTYVAKGTGKCVVAVWVSDKPPVEEMEAVAADIAVAGAAFEEPVYVDLLTGEVRAFGREAWAKEEKGCRFKGVRVYDSPILIAEKALIRIREKK